MPDRVIMVRESTFKEMREALRDLLACPAISDGGLSDPEWGCQESAEAEAKARAALAKSEATHPAPDGCGREEAAVNDPKEIYLSPPCCSDMVGEGRLWCENDEWPEGDCGTPEEHRPATRYVRADLAHAADLKSEWREMREALRAAREFIANEYCDPSQQPHGEWLAPEARPAFEKLCAALAKAEAVP